MRMTQIDNEGLRRRALECAGRVVRDAAPVRMVSLRGTLRATRNKTVERLAVPLGTGRTVTHVLGLTLLSDSA
jgi:hypothetical protein